MAATSYSEAVEQAIISSNQLHDLVNGAGDAEVTVEDGSTIPTVRKALIENFYFKSPIDWEQGKNETVFNQLRFFDNGPLSGYYYAPRATASSPMPMGATPATDPNWVLYAVQQEQLPAEVYPWLFEGSTGEETVISPPYIFDSAIVTINGVVQIPGAAYSIVNSQIILNEPLGTDPSTGASNLLFAYIGKTEEGTNDYIQTSLLTSAIGGGMGGEISSAAQLRTTLQSRTNQKVLLKGYNNGSTKGGGSFYWITDSVTPDDGGTFFRVNSSGGWRRQYDDPAKLTVCDFGATMDGVTDDMPALLRMHNWSRSINVTYGPGIRIPSGVIALSSMDLGDTEIPAFKLRGPDIDFGVIPALTVVPTDKTTTIPMFKYKARRTEVANMRFNGLDTVQPFLVNTVTRGAYMRVSCFVASDAGGRVFQFKDTLDSKFDQVYSYRGKAAFIWGTWSNENPGAWDHLTAIEISNFNFGNHTNEYAVSLIRAGQSLMTNGWFDKCEYPFDISQGGWTLDRVTMENATNPAATKYAKIIQKGCRFAQGAGLDDTVSGYLPSMDTNGQMPAWVTNAYDNGGINLDLTGSSFDGGLAAEFNYSDTIFQNTTGTETWVHAARITQQGRGRTCHLKFLGASGYDSTGSSISRPTSTNFGGGVAHVFWELKYPDVANSQAGQVHWYGEGNCPIKEVRYVHSWQTVHVYVKLAAYALSTSMFIESNGDPRRKTGQPFYVVPYGEILTQAEMDAVTNNQVAVSRWAINKGTYESAGIGLDLDSGKLLLQTASADQAGSRYLTTSFYGVDQYIPLQTTNQSVRLPRYAYADLPSASTNVYGVVLCTNTTLSPAMQLLYSNGSTWYLASDPTSTTWKPV